MTRHIARLDRDDVPGTLMLAEVDNLANTIRLLGPDGGDQVLSRAATLLRGAVRPTDLVGRTGDTEFAVWLSGADHLTAAERAEDLCLEAPSQVIGPDNATAVRGQLLDRDRHAPGRREFLRSGRQGRPGDAAGQGARAAATGASR